MRISPRLQFILTIVAMVVLVIVVAVAVVWPQHRAVGTMDAKLVAANQEVGLQKTRLAQREEIKNRASQTDAKWLMLATEVPTSPDLPSLIIELQDLAFSTGVQLTGITPQAPLASADGTYWSVPVNVVAIGTWADSVEFLQRLNTLDRGLRTVNVKSTLPSDSEMLAADPKLPAYSVKNTIDLEAYLIPATPSATTP